MLAEPDVVQAFATLKATDLPGFLRLRQAAKLANRDCSLSLLDELVSHGLLGAGSGPDRRHGDASALDELVALARSHCQLFHDADRLAVAVISCPGSPGSSASPAWREVWRVQSSGFESWLRAAYWRAHQGGVADSTMKAVLATLSAAGINDGEQVAVHVRTARWNDGSQDCYVIDLCNAQWQAVVVSPSGWKVVTPSPVLFTRTPSMRPLPMPILGGDVGLLWQHTNVPASQRVMVLTWLLDCLRPDTPFPVLELVGEQGSAKSTTQPVLRSLVDPNKVMLRGRPKTVEDVFVAAANNWVVS